MFHVKHRTASRIRSEERPFGRNAHSSGVLVRTDRRLDDHLAPIPPLTQLHAELSESVALPTIAAVRRLAHDQQPARGQKPTCALGGHGWRTETSRRHQVTVGPQRRIVRQFFGPAATHLHPVIESEPADRPDQESGSSFVGVQQNPATGWPRQCQDQARQSAPAAEINRLDWRDVIASPGEPASVVDVRFDRSWTEEAQLLGSGQDRSEFRVVRSAHPGRMLAQPWGMSTTRRR
jgi:hypothetical protein